MDDDFTSMSEEQRCELGKKLGGAIKGIMEVLARLDGMTFEEAMDTYCWDWILNRAAEANENEGI